MHKVGVAVVTYREFTILLWAVSTSRELCEVSVVRISVVRAQGQVCVHAKVYDSWPHAEATKNYCSVQSITNVTA